MNVHDLENRPSEPAVALDTEPEPQPPADGGFWTAVRDTLRRVVRRTWFFPSLLTLAFGLFRVGRPELWRDELRSWSAASRSIGDLINLLWNTDAAVALYYFFLHYWVQLFGDSAVSLRMPSVLAMVGSAGVVCLIGQRLFDRRVAIFAGLLFAIIPNISRFSQEARPYAITVLIALLSTLLLLRAIEKPSWHRIALYGLSVIVLALIQLTALPLILVHAVGAWLWARQDRRLLVWLGSSAAAGMLLALPVLLFSRSQYNHQVGALPDASIRELTQLPPRLFASGAIAGAVIMLSILGFTTRRQAAVFLAAWAVIPAAAIWLASQGPNSYWMTRYVLISVPGWALLAAAGLATLNLRMAIAAIAVVAALGAPDQRAVRLVEAHDVWNYPEGTLEFLDYSEAAAFLAANARPGDGIAYSERGHFWLNDIGLAYHMRGTPMPRDVFVEKDAIASGDFWPEECHPYAPCLHGEERIWIVSTDWYYETTPYKYMEPDKAAIFQNNYVIVDQFRPYKVGITLTLVVHRSRTGLAD